MYDEKRRNGELAAAREDGIAEGLAEGHAKGLAEGLAEGHAKGLAEGHAEGHAEGLAEGHAEGHAEAKIEMAIKLKALGVDIDTIVQATGLDREAIQSL